MLSISLLVLLHEGGHFLFAKLFGIRVEKFYLFFDPYFSLFKFKPKNSDTTYGIGWLPLGGYCKISGMIDESFDTDQMKQPAQPWEFRTKPAWQRLLVMVGGVLVNFITAMVIYIMILFSWGESYVPTRNMHLGMCFNDEAKALGLRDGDVLVGTNLGEFKGFNANMFRDLSEAKRVDIVRGGKEMSVAMPGDLNLLTMLKNEPKFVEPLIPNSIDSVLPGTPAAALHLQKGMKIVALNGKSISSFNQFKNQMGVLSDRMAVAKTAADSLKVRNITLVVEANGAKDTLKTTLTPQLQLGFAPPQLYSLYEPVTKDYGFLESIPAGIKYGIEVLAGYVDDLKYVFSSDGAKSLGGFGTIGSLFPPTWDWYMFWNMTAFLSIILAFMNILPIPALDGGHVLFLIYEMVTGRKPSENFLIKAEYVGFGLVFLLLIVANLNDILRWLGYM